METKHKDGDKLILSVFLREEKANEIALGINLYKPNGWHSAFTVYSEEFLGWYVAFKEENGETNGVMYDGYEELAVQIEQARYLAGGGKIALVP